MEGGIETVDFAPDYRHMADVARNVRPARLPLYEHTVGGGIMEKALGREFAGLAWGRNRDLHEYFRQFCRFFKEMTYDVVSFEVGLCPILPGHGALSGGGPGPIQSREDFDKYPWADISEKFWAQAGPRYDALVEALPPGMKIVGGVGYGVFEISEDLVGLEHLPFMMVDEPELYVDLYNRIGDMLCTIWAEMVKRYGDSFVICRIGDDMGFKSSLLTTPATVRDQVLPQYRRIIKIVHEAGLPFLLHSCGCIFDVMDDLIAAGIDAKHSNEDVIAPFDRWIELYGDRIGLLGGFDTDLLCRLDPQQITELVLDNGARYRRTAKGFALGSGNSIPPYVPPECYLAMIYAAQELRNKEQSS